MVYVVFQDRNGEGYEQHPIGHAMCVFCYDVCNCEPKVHTTTIANYNLNITHSLVCVCVWCGVVCGVCVVCVW